MARGQLTLYYRTEFIKRNQSRKARIGVIRRDYNKETINDTQTMHWKIYYVHPQSGCVLFLDMLC